MELKTCILSSLRWVTDKAPIIILHNSLTSPQKDHPSFKREGDDLRTIVELDLKEALTGWKRTISTIYATDEWRYDRAGQGQVSCYLDCTSEGGVEANSLSG